MGSFDGVHRGHRTLLDQVRSIADELCMEAIAITFCTPPKSVLGITHAPQLNSKDERITLLRQAGMDEVIVLDFTPTIAAMSARDFMTQVLKEELHVDVLIIGYDHRFGRGRTEGFDDYVHYGEELGIEVIRGEICTDNERPISSTRIRHLLAEGNVVEASHLLSYHYMLHGKVVDGYKEGRKIGFPTANIRPISGNKLIPADGVYAVWVSVTDKCLPIGEERMAGMLNIGYRPTLNNGRERSIEVHILNYEGTLYGKEITVEFVYRIRNEQTFDNLRALTEQLHKDKVKAEEFLSQKRTTFQPDL